MNIPLAEFEQIINDTILQRGLAYYKNGYVTEITELSPGEYEAIVLGRNTYSVSFTLENNVITWYNCDCPYDQGPVCKHLVAVIFELQQHVLEPDVISLNSKKGKDKSISVMEQVKEILKKLSHEELIAFIEGTTKNNKTFRSHFLASFGHLTGDLTKGFFQKQIRGVLISAAGRQGYISWNEMPVMVAGISPILENAENYFNHNNFRNVFYISSALLEEMTGAFEYADDSNGDIGFHIDFALEMLHKLAEENLPGDLRKDLFTYGISSYKSNEFSGWDWHLGMLKLAGEATKNEQEADVILELLETPFERYEQHQAQVLQLSLIETYKSEKQAKQFIEAHLSNPQIRRSEIQKALQKGDFGLCIELARMGIKNDEKEYPGLAKEWYDWLLKIAEAQGDIPNLIKYSRYLYLDNHMSSRNYYQLLKDNVPATNWPAFVNELIGEIKASKGWGSTHLLQEIYIKEKWWDQLFLSISKNSSLEEIERFEEYLAQDYSSELVELYAKNCIAYLKNNLGRKHYQKVCRYLRRMKKLGGEEKQKELSRFFKEEYSRRPALMEELGKI